MLQAGKANENNHSTHNYYNFSNNVDAKKFLIGLLSKINQGEILNKLVSSSNNIHTCGILMIITAMKFEVSIKVTTEAANV